MTDGSMKTENTFAFDEVISTAMSQKEVFELVAGPVLERTSPSHSRCVEWLQLYNLRVRPDF